MSGVFAARFAGRCDACDGRIRVDDKVRFNDDDQVVHATCEVTPLMARPVVICPTCHLTKPCDCT